MPANPAFRTERPWGRWAVLDKGRGYKIKRLEVEPGHRLSLQYHSFRAEQWIVISGVGRATLNKDIVALYPGVHVQVDKEMVHRIVNDGEMLLVILELQIGEICSEEDIVRIEDDYDRADAETGEGTLQ